MGSNPTASATVLKTLWLTLEQNGDRLRKTALTVGAFSGTFATNSGWWTDPMQTPLGRIVIYTKKIDEMAAFYVRHFGFEVVQRAGDRIVELAPPGPGAAILLHPASARQKEGQVLVKLVFDVEDVPAFCDMAQEGGFSFGKVHKVDGYVFANAKDPAGNSIQVSSRAFAVQVARDGGQT